MVMAFIAYGRIQVRLFDLPIAHTNMFTLTLLKKDGKKRLLIWHCREEH